MYWLWAKRSNGLARSTSETASKLIFLTDFYFATATIFRLISGVGMDNDDASECSIELGMVRCVLCVLFSIYIPSTQDYDRIEYPEEVYDLVCGRSTNEQPLAKKQVCIDKYCYSKTKKMPAESEWLVVDISVFTSKFAVISSIFRQWSWSSSHFLDYLS